MPPTSNFSEKGRVLTAEYGCVRASPRLIPAREHPSKVSARFSAASTVPPLVSKDKIMNDEIPRRVRLDLMTLAELAIRNAVLAVEEVGADIRLTQAINLLNAAQTRVADFVDGVDGYDTFPQQLVK